MIKILYIILVNKVISKIHSCFKNLILIKIIFICIYYNRLCID